MIDASWVFAIARPAIAFSIVVGLLAWLLRTGLASRVLDHPNARSLHRAPTPRIGGLAILAGILGGGVALAYEHLVLVYFVIFALAIISLIDDLKSLPVWQRFLTHLVAATIGVFFLADGQALPMQILVVLAIVWMTNLFNFMDGADGLAGGMAFFGFTLFALQAATTDTPGLTTLNAVIAASALGFLLFNFHPARVFMGDAGSIPLGFLAGLIGFTGWVKGVWPAWFPILVFSPFIVDATLTLLKRALRGEKIWQAHREHYYQRLILLGHGHRKIAWLEYGLMFMVGVSAWWGAQQPTTAQAILLGIWLIVYFVLARWIDRRWHAAGKQS